VEVDKFKKGDLVRFTPPRPPKGYEVPDCDLESHVGIYLGEKTFDGKYTCSLVHFLDGYGAELSPIRPIQTNLLTLVNSCK
jgi:hypothetical protein